MATPQSAEKKISVILSNEARCFGVFWFGRGAPSLLIKKRFYNEKVAFLFLFTLMAFYLDFKCLDTELGKNAQSF